MTDRQTRIAVDLFTAAVVASVGVALAGLTWRLTGDPGTSLGAAPVTVPAPEVDLGPVIASAPFGSPVAQAPVVGGSLQLRGILFAHPESASTALIAINGGPAKGYHVGEPVGRAVIGLVAIDHVVLRGRGGQTLFLPGAEARPTDAMAAAVTTTSTPAPAKPAAESEGIAAIRALIPQEVRGDPLKQPVASAAPEASSVKPSPDQARAPR